MSKDKNEITKFIEIAERAAELIASATVTDRWDIAYMLLNDVILPAVDKTGVIPDYTALKDGTNEDFVRARVNDLRKLAGALKPFVSALPEPTKKDELNSFRDPFR